MLCDKKIPLRLKGRVYRMIVRLASLYRAECWPIKKTQVQRMIVTEMRMIWYMSDHRKSDWTRNELIRDNIGVYWG